MFNGIIYNTGNIHSIKKTKNSLFLGIKSKLRFNHRELGSSVCCDGVCLTLVKIKKNIVYFYISKETLARSKFKLSKKNDIINLEKSISFGQRISGHFTQGHVDTVAKIQKIKLNRYFSNLSKSSDNKTNQAIILVTKSTIIRTGSILLILLR